MALDVRKGSLDMRKGSPKWKLNVPNTTYTISWSGYLLFCSCPAFKYQRLPVSERLCKHIKFQFPAYIPLTQSLYPVEKFPAPQLPLFGEYDADKHDISKWFWSEKYDGVRCYWNGKTLLTRNGNSIRAPDDFIAMLPKNVKLDGELAGPHDSFERTLEALQVGPPCHHWNSIRFHVFDMPTDDEITFYDRYQDLLFLNREHPSRAWKVVTQHRVENLDEMKHRLKNMTREGAEGIVLRNPNGFYKRGRNVKVGLKWKLVTYGNGEVISKGDKHGSYLIAETAEPPVQFMLHISPHDDVNIHVGTRIRFCFRGRTSSGKPKFPAFENVNK